MDQYVLARIKPVPGSSHPAKRVHRQKDEADASPETSAKVGTLCGRCASLRPLVREALRLGARWPEEDVNAPKFDRWREIKRELASKGKTERIGKEPAS